MTIAEVDALLDELASKSGYTQASIRSKYTGTQRRPRKAIIRALFRQLSPEDASILVQIILKDLRPILYPLTEFHYTTALTRFDVASVKMLSKEHAMDIWDPSGLFLRYYRVCADITEAAAFADSPKSEGRFIGPTIGKPVAVSTFISINLRLSK
jgi:DNA ligase-4